MRVVVTEAFRAYINMQPENFHTGQKIKGNTALYLLQVGAAVEPEDEEADAVVRQLTTAEVPEEQQEPIAHREPCVDGSVCGGEHCPPAEPEETGELVLDASIPAVMAWVGDDQDRAETALRAERARDVPRTTLVKQLEKLTESA